MMRNTALILKNVKRYLALWIVLLVVVNAVICGVFVAKGIARRQASVSVSFSFDGVESGTDPLGNKFDVNEIKSKEAIEKALKELGIENADADKIYSNIFISGIIPSDVIDRITRYDDIYTGTEIEQSKNIKDLTYYPTQYTITMDCFRIDMSYSDCVKLLNRLAEDYRGTFFDSYGYKSSIGDAIMSIDYSEYDYIEAVDIYDAELSSLEDYVNELSGGDEVRFRSEKSGYTFADLAKSIETLRTEDLDMLSAEIVGEIITKAPDSLLASYRLKLEKLELDGASVKKQLDSVNETLDVYQSDTVMLFGSGSSDPLGIEYNISSESYKKLIDRKVTLQKQLEDNKQQSEKFKKRIDDLSGLTAAGKNEHLENGFKALDEKTDRLLEDVSVTVNDYYRNVKLKNAYEVIPSKKTGIMSVAAESLKDSLVPVLSAVLIITGVFLLICAAAAVNGPDGAAAHFLDTITLKKKKAPKGDEKE